MEVATAREVVSAETEEGIIRRYDRLIGFLARRFRIDTDDLIQVGRVALLQAFRAWPTKPHTSSFWTYARKAVLGEMLNFTTSEVTRQIKEAESGLLPSAPCAPDAACEAREHVSALGEREAAVLEMYVAGYPVPEIASQNNISRSRAYQILEGSLENIQRRA
jgi:RNA polymerase sigma factor (sigma-70 family)